ncbi:MAG: GNAT family N-acetyltransferase [Ruminococcus bromii]|nr:GNAT family N-acetyltransferase [Ruminococcus bromii]
MTPSKEQLLDFLRAVDGDFPVPLSARAELTAYTEKLLSRATLCADYKNGALCALVAGYTENLPADMAYIALAATRQTDRRQGRAYRLMQDFLAVCAQKNIPAVHLYTDPSNTAAIGLYRRLGFVPYRPKDEPRPMDGHWIYVLKGEDKL